MGVKYDQLSTKVVPTKKLIFDVKNEQIGYISKTVDPRAKSCFNDPY